MKTQADIEPIVNVKAKLLALTFGLLHISTYLFLTIVFFVSEKFLNTLFDYYDQIAFLTYTSFLISLIIACAFHIVPRQKREEVALLYGVFFAFNLVTLLIYLGMRNFTMTVT